MAYRVLPIVVMDSGAINLVKEVICFLHFILLISLKIN
jgi:hypothetical protein